MKEEEDSSPFSSWVFQIRYSLTPPPTRNVLAAQGAAAPRAARGRAGGHAGPGVRPLAVHAEFGVVWLSGKGGKPRGYRPERRRLCSLHTFNDLQGREHCVDVYSACTR